MITKLLIANRGEIACRIIRTCRRMGIGTVAVYSDADATARHVREADEAVRIGPAAARQSYLDEQAILSAAIERGADAIHPGYGFLSEKLELIDACTHAGIVFVGPHRDAIARMGSKIESKRIARGANVSCVPGYDGDDQSVERLATEAAKIGLPLLIKASAGGGGKGMKLVRHEDELLKQLAAAKAEALAAFGDDKVLLERFIERPRHLEVQLLGDRHGNLIHLFERECSIQRNYQKVIEEAPAAHLSEEVRDQLFACALALGRAIGYDSAGTVEFVLDADNGDRPYFLEMNTRLQVEHTVTEMITGLDLVEHQIRSAIGQPIPFAQADIRSTGWAIEARINAEVPEDDFRASYGPVTRYCEGNGAGVRIDSGVDGMSVITPHYDSMLAKLIGSGATRAVACERLRKATRQFQIGGIETNQGMVDTILGEAAFDRVLTTRFLSDVFPDGWQPEARRHRSCRGAAAAAWYFNNRMPGDRPMDCLAGFRLAGSQQRAGFRLNVEGPGGAVPVLIETISADVIDVVLEDERIGFSLGANGTIWDDNGIRFDPTVEHDSVQLWSDGHERHWRVRSATASAMASQGSPIGDDTIIAELPGVVTQLLVVPGQMVASGEPLLVIEAMKLLHTLLAPRDGRVMTVGPTVGDTVGKGTLLVALEPHEQFSEG